LEHVLFFHSAGKFIIPTDEVHHFSEGVGWNHQPGDHWKSFSSLIYPWIAWWIVPSFFGSRLPFRVNLHFPMGFPMGFPFSHGFPMVFPWFSCGFPHEILVISMSTLQSSPGSSRFGLHSWPRCDGHGPRGHGVFFFSVSLCIILFILVGLELT
jgi:hypothetical protein